MDIRRFLPNITNEDVVHLASLSCHEWVIARRIYREKISKNKTIERKDLCQSFPKDKLDRANEAIDSLIKKRIIGVSSKPNAQNFHSDGKLFRGIVTVFLDKITEDSELKDALINEEVEFTKTSETLITIIENKMRPKINGRDYSLRASTKKAFDGVDLGLIIDMTMRCENHISFDVSFEILYPNDLFEDWNTKIIKCECGNIHTCVAYGKMY